MTAIGRPCATCNHANIREITARVLAGDSVTRVAVENRLSTSSIYRHFRSHVSEDVRESLSPAQRVEVSDIVERIFSVADDLRTTRDRARGNGSAATAVRAASAELRALESLIERLGIDSREVAESLARGELLGRAVGAVTRQHPQLVKPLADELRTRGDPELAAALEASQPTQHNELEQQA